MSALDAEVWATLAATVIGVVVLTFEHLKARSPNKEVSDRLDNHDQQLGSLTDTLKSLRQVLDNWKNT